MPKEKDTIWRLTEDDFRAVIADKFPHLSEHQIEYIIDKAHDKFYIPDWTDFVEAFIDTWI
jgi:uncharacterized protein (DUF433 family)